MTDVKCYQTRTGSTHDGKTLHGFVEQLRRLADSVETLVEQSERSKGSGTSRASPTRGLGQSRCFKSLSGFLSAHTRGTPLPGRTIKM